MQSGECGGRSGRTAMSISMGITIVAASAICEELDARITAQNIELFRQGERVALHG
jgi:hypothetical protein